MCFKQLSSVFCQMVPGDGSPQGCFFGFSTTVTILNKMSFRFYVTIYKREVSNTGVMYRRIVRSKDAYILCNTVQHFGQYSRLDERTMGRLIQVETIELVPYV